MVSLNNTTDPVLDGLIIVLEWGSWDNYNNLLKTHDEAGRVASEKHPEYEHECILGITK